MDENNFPFNTQNIDDTHQGIEAEDEPDIEEEVKEY